MKVIFPIEGKYILCTYQSLSLGRRMILAHSEKALIKAFDHVLEKRDPKVKIESVVDIEIVCPTESFRKRVLKEYLQEDLILIESEVMYRAQMIAYKTGLTPKGFEWVDLHVDHELIMIEGMKKELLERAFESPLFRPVRKGFEPRGRVVKGKGLKMVQVDAGPHRPGIVTSKAYPSAKVPLFYYLELGDSGVKESLLVLQTQYQERSRIRFQALKDKRDEERRLRELAELPRTKELYKFFGIDPNVIDSNVSDTVR